MPSPVSAAQGYDSIYLLAAAMKQAGGTEGRKLKDALENLNEKVEGVVTTYDHPFTKTDHEAITANMPVFGVVTDGRVQPERAEDLAGDKALRVKPRSLAAVLERYTDPSARGRGVFFSGPSIMQILAQLIVSGIAVGMIYGVIAFGYQLTFATSKTLNFGQGEALMLGSLVGLTMTYLVGYWAMLPVVLVFGLAQGWWSSGWGCGRRSR